MAAGPSGLREHITFVIDETDDQRIVERVHRSGRTEQQHLYRTWVRADRRGWVTVPGCCRGGEHEIRT